MQVDSLDADTIEEDKHNKLRCLNRQEWLQVLVMVAISKYVKTGQIPDVSDAIDQLFRVDFAPRVPRAAAYHANAYRKRYLYLERVDHVLRKHLKTIRSLYDRYSDFGEDDFADKLGSTSLMSIGEWMACCTHLGFFDYQMLSFYEAKIIFLYSRIRSVRDHSDRSISTLSPQPLRATPYSPMAA